MDRAYYTNYRPIPLSDRIKKSRLTITTGSYKIDTPTLGELSEILTSLDLPDAMSIEEFLSNLEEQDVYVIPDDNELVELCRKQTDLPTNSNSEESDDPK
ncbi:303_t:CDS:2 [Paraglomus occultum]|uniref:303_t:CDS:1 n=1 Tax=Paraglomus occultum TaxID=144539 RepID=A0A9N9BCP6_9GLOM|nr:303_t:CDS:2 [Paraglomus occultum]